MTVPFCVVIVVAAPAINDDCFPFLRLPVVDIDLAFFERRGYALYSESWDKENGLNESIFGTLELSALQ